MASMYTLLDEDDKLNILDIARDLIRNADFCEIYESNAFSDSTEEKLLQAFKYLTDEIHVSRDM